MSSDVHERCWIDEHCSAKDCPAGLAVAKRALERGREWGALDVRTEVGGLRHYLDGEPVHCGTGLVLQAREDRYDDYGGYTVHLDSGAHVRYEARIGHDKIEATLHAVVAGTVFVAEHEPWMRFRWPERA